MSRSGFPTNAVKSLPQLTSMSFLFNAACGALAPEPSTGRDFDSDVAKIPVGPKTQRKFNASVIQIGLETTQEQSRTLDKCRNQNGISMNSIQCKRVSKYHICSFCSPHQDLPFSCITGSTCCVDPPAFWGGKSCCPDSPTQAQLWCSPNLMAEKPVLSTNEESVNCLQSPR